MSAKTKLYHERKAQGLCVDCGGKPVENRTRCERCAAFNRMYRREKYARMTPEQKQHQKEVHARWVAAHPDRVAEYRKRKKLYNRRYAEKA